MIEISRQPNQQPALTDLTIKVIGLGGAGINALDRIQLDGFADAELIAMNTDAQSLAMSVAPRKIQIGRQATRGLGAGGDPEIGYAAAEEALDDVRPALEDTNLVFMCVGLGGGTGCGAAPLLANLARQQNALTVVFATLPFTFEGRRRMAQAEEALASLQEQADVVICFENDRMGDAVSPKAGIQEAFGAADQTISQSVRAIAALLQRKGLIGVGFDELTSALRAQNPRCLFGYGEADGDNRAHAALERALRSSVMDRGRMLAEAANVLVHVAGGPSMTLNEVQVLMEEFNRHISDTTRLLFSTSVDQRLGAKMAVTLISAIGEARAAAPVRMPAPRIERAPAAAPASAPEPGRAGPPIPPLAEADEPEPQFGEAAAAAHHESSFRDEEYAEAAAAPAGVPQASQSAARSNGRARTSREEKQEQMQFEPVTRGRFEKSEPTIEGGQDLDVPTFLRQNVKVR